MSTTQEETTRNIRKDTPPKSDPTKIDRAAPAGSENFLGAESVRDGRPATHDGYCSGDSSNVWRWSHRDESTDNCASHR
jgi:hypothetical protein